MKKKFSDKAKESLKSSQILFDNGLYDDSASRAYYAAFRAAIAVLAQYGIRRLMITIISGYRQLLPVNSFIGKKFLMLNSGLICRSLSK